MTSLKQRALSALLHTVEVLAAFGVAYLALKVFNVDAAPVLEVLSGLVLVYLAKLQRTSGTDYVNGS